MPFSWRGMREKSVTSIKAKLLTEYALAADGTHCRICFIDGEGSEQSVEFPVAGLRQLFFDIPRIPYEPTSDLHQEAPLGPVHVVKSWKVHSTPRQEAIFTFTTPDNCTISFSITRQELGDLADAAAEYELEAFPDGLSFPQH